MPGACCRGGPRTAWKDNIKKWTGLPMEESVRMSEDRYKWRWLKNRTEPRLTHIRQKYVKQFSTVRKITVYKQRTPATCYQVNCSKLTIQLYDRVCKAARWHNITTFSVRLLFNTELKSLFFANTFHWWLETTLTTACMKWSEFETVNYITSLQTGFFLCRWQTYKKLAPITRARNLRGIERAPFDVRNSREKYLAASRYDTRTSFSCELTRTSFSFVCHGLYRC